MAGIPLKSGADFYNLEASRMRLHNLGADPTEVGTGLIYFNTSTGMNTSGRARIYTGNGFKSLAFLEDVDGRIKTIEDMLNVDTAEGVVSTWNEIQAFLDSVQEGTDLMDLLNGKLDKTGGTISGTTLRPLIVETTASAIETQFKTKDGVKIYLGWNDIDGIYLQENVSQKYIGIKTDGTPYYYNGARNTLLHSGNYSDYALPKAGGTITGALTISSPSWGEQLIINRTTANTAPSIKFQNNGTTLGFLGMRTNETLYYAPSTGGDGYDILTSAGGTISGTSNSLLTINSTAATSYITFQRSGANKAEVGWDNGLGAYIGNSANGYCVGVRDNGTPVFYDTTFHTLLHSGNVGYYAIRVNNYNIQIDSDVNIAGYGRTADGWPVTGPAMILGSNDRNYTMLLSGRNGVLRFNTTEAGSLTGWKTIAFTDSNVASATKLVTEYGSSYAEYTEGTTYIGLETSSNTVIKGNAINLRYGSGTNGLILNSEGNVTIGDRDLAGTNAKLYVDGVIKAKDALELICSTKTAMGAYIYMGEKHLTIESAELNVGYNVPLVLNPKAGNVLIGTSTDTGERLQVDGLFKVYEATNRRLYTQINASSIQVGRISSYTSGYKAGVAYGVDGTAEGYIAGLYDVTKDNVRYFFYGGDENNAPLFIRNNNVLIGTKEDKGYKLYVDGSVAMKNQGDGAELLRFGTERPWHFIQKGTGSATSLMLSTTQDNKAFEIGDVNNKAIIQFYASSTTPVVYVDAQLLPLTNNAHRLGSNTSRWSTIYSVNGNFSGNMTIDGDLHVKGNIIADGEVSSGGAAEESGEGGGGTGGGVEPYVFTFTPSTTTVSVNHNISSEDVIVQVYEKDATSGKWNVILVDIEIVDSTRVDLHFGRTETTEHKVVIIG